MKEAYFAGGCFWCIGGFFEQMEGVISVTSGYSGGDEKDPSYEDVKAQKTGHRETIKITYDEGRIGYKELLDFFLANGAVQIVGLIHWRCITRMRTRELPRRTR